MPPITTEEPPSEVKSNAHPVVDDSFGQATTTTARSENLESIDEHLEELHHRIVPVWPLRDYVAVNPFLGWSDGDLLATRSRIRSLREAELLPSWSDLRASFQHRDFTLDDVESALEECRRADPHVFRHVTMRGLDERLHGEESDGVVVEEPRLRMATEQIDAVDGAGWTRIVVDEIGRHCAAHYDEGHAQWPSPWRDLSLYAAWHASCTHDHRFSLMGLAHFEELVRDLPSDPREAVAELLAALDVPVEIRREYLLCAAYSIAGWSSFVRYRVRESEFRGEPNDDLVGLVAIRLAYDVAVARSPKHAIGLAFELPERTAPPLEAARRYVLQMAAELSFRRQLLGGIARQAKSGPASNTRKSAQMVFCIDVRSEVIRRHLEATGADLQTMGFAGFFGMPIEYVPLEGGDGTPQCPALIDPPMTARESLREDDPDALQSIRSQRLAERLRAKTWKSFQTAASSCFSFVESLGLGYAAGLLASSLRWRRSAGVGRDDRLGPRLDPPTDGADELQQQVELAAGMLTNLGLTTGQARLVVLCGHGASTANNPYQAGLDCGACCGHSGESNARLAASLLNRHDVRIALAERGLEIPQDTWFVAGVHNTTTDEIRFHDVDLVPASHRAELQALGERSEEAARRARAERALRMGQVEPETLGERGRDWSETRPEWGLAGNAAFVVGPRECTAGLDLGGRAFLHDYDHDLDPEGRVLETLLTAPLVVTSWINLQYYASAVDNHAYGSGSKVLHNVVGRFGVVQGNGGDLMTGLPWQSVHDGERFQHLPLRLLAVVAAPRSVIGRILAENPGVGDLARNGWITLVALEGDATHRYTADGDWEALSPDAIRRQLPDDAETTSADI